MRLVRTLPWLLVGAALSGTLQADPPGPATPNALPTLGLPGIDHAVGFDDMRTDPADGSVWVPGGVTGQLFRVEPGSRAVTALGGLAAASAWRGHNDGPTSIAFAPGVLLASDRTSRTVDVIDRSSGQRLGQIALDAPPDYVRFVSATNEIWVTSPHAHRITVYDATALLATHGAAPVRATIDVPGGPEALEIDRTRGVAYTNVWPQGRTAVIDLHTHAIRANWANGCTHDDSQGLALDEARGQLFTACEDGAVHALDVRDGHVLGSGRAGAGVDIIAYDAVRHHLYAPAESGSLTVFGVSANGALSMLARWPAPSGTHCVAVDRTHTVYVCDPNHGRLAVLDDAGRSP